MITPKSTTIKIILLMLLQLTGSICMGLSPLGNKTIFLLSVAIYAFFSMGFIILYKK